MTESSQKTSPKERASTYLYFSSLYFVTVGVLYLWGYWSTFNVNILEYLSLADIIKSTAYPIASTFVFLAIGALFGAALSDDSHLPPGAGRNTRTGRALHRVLPWLVLLYVIGTLGLLMFGPVEKWLVLPVLFAGPAYIYARRSGIFSSILPHDSSRAFVIFLMATLPTFAYGLGRIQAQEIVDGVKFEYALSPIENVIIPPDATPTQRPRFIGHTGDFIFFLEPTRATLAITKFEGAKALVLKHFEQVSQVPAARPTPPVERPAKGLRP